MLHNSQVVLRHAIFKAFLDQTLIVDGILGITHELALYQFLSLLDSSIAIAVNTYVSIGLCHIHAKSTLIRTCFGWQFLGHEVEHIFSLLVELGSTCLVALGFSLVSLHCQCVAKRVQSAAGSSNHARNCLVKVDAARFSLVESTPLELLGDDFIHLVGVTWLIITSIVGAKNW